MIGRFKKTSLCSNISSSISLENAISRLISGSTNKVVALIILKLIRFAKI